MIESNRFHTWDLKLVINMRVRHPIKTTWTGKTFDFRSETTTNRVEKKQGT